MIKKIYTIYGIFSVYPNEDKFNYDVFLDDEFMANYSSTTPFNIKKFDYELIEYFSTKIAK